ncbi:MAG TPA: DUF2905 domain-containing protein [Candidatus Dormibacteraeota bacterium]|jgi:Na+/phosphate symporter
MTAGKLLIGLGVLILAVGIAVQAGLPLGRLPGDIKFSRGAFTFYSPLVTGLILSVVLTVLLNVFFRR